MTATLERDLEFGVIRPMTINDAALTTNVAENEYDDYVSTRVYDLGERTQVDGTDSHLVYESKIGDSEVVTITIATPGVVTWTGHGFSAGKRLRFSTTGALPTGLVAGTSYYLVTPLTNTFQVSATLGGAAINTTGSQSGVHTCVASDNIGKTPADNPDYWTEVYDTNRWRMFDLSSNSVTSNADEIDVTIATTGRCPGVYVGGTNARTIQVIQTDAIDGVVYDETFNMVDNDAIYDHYDYCFSPIERKESLCVTDLFPYGNADVQVIQSDTGETVECAVLIVGEVLLFGDCEVEPQIGIDDYSINQVDEFGTRRLEQRGYNAVAGFVVYVQSAFVDPLYRRLKTFRATPLVWFGSTEYELTTVFGTYESFTLAVPYSDGWSVWNLNLKGL